MWFLLGSKRRSLAPIQRTLVYWRSRLRGSNRTYKIPGTLAAFVTEKLWNGADL